MVVGWREWVALPELNIPAVRAKIDTGARISSLHATGMTPFTKGGQPWLRFETAPLRYAPKQVISCEAPLIDRRQIRSSNGIETERFIIFTTLELNGQRWPIEVSVTDRSAMLNRMLIGRTAMRNRLVVNPSRSFLVSAPPAGWKSPRKKP